jgi:hypothetical protein
MDAAVILSILFIGVIGVVSIVSLVCFIMVVVKMFQHDQTGLGIACVVLALCTGLGSLIAFVYGWVKAGEWNIKPLMAVWTGCVAVTLLLVIMMPVMATMVGTKANQTFLIVGSSLNTGGSTGGYRP